MKDVVVIKNNEVYGVNFFDVYKDASTKERKYCIIVDVEGFSGDDSIHLIDRFDQVRLPPKVLLNYLNSKGFQSKMDEIHKEGRYTELEKHLKSVKKKCKPSKRDSESELHEKVGKLKLIDELLEVMEELK